MATYVWKVVKGYDLAPYYIEADEWEDTECSLITTDEVKNSYDVNPAGYLKVNAEVVAFHGTGTYGRKCDVYDTGGNLVTGVWVYNIFLSYTEETDTEPVEPEEGDDDDPIAPSYDEDDIDGGSIWTGKGSYIFSGDASAYERGHTDVYVYDRDGIANKWTGSGLCGPLRPTSCERTAELNGDDTVTMEHPYDAAGKWKYLKPGRVLKVWILTQVPEKSAQTVAMTQQYGTIATSSTIGTHDWSPMDRIPSYDEATMSERDRIDTIIADLDVVSGSVKTGTAFDNVLGYENDDTYDGHWDVYNVDCTMTDGTKKTDQYVDAKWVTIYTTVSTTSHLQLPYEYRAEQYTIISVDFGETGVTVTARARSIDDCQYLYSARTDDAEELMAQKMSDIVTASIANVTASGQSMGDIRMHCYVDDTAITGYRSVSGTLHSMFDTLKNKFTFDVLRDGRDIYIYNYLGSNRGVTLEVGRNLTALGVTYETTDADMDGTLTYYADDADTTHYALDKQSTPASGTASRVYAMQDANAAAQYDAMGTGAANAVLGPDATQYSKNRLKKSGVYKLTVTPEVFQKDDGGAVPIELREPLLIGDTVTIRDPRLVFDDGSVQLRITASTQDCLTGRVTAITVGDLPEKLTDVIYRMIRG